MAKVLVVGDLHCNYLAARQAVTYANGLEVDEVWQVGDFGFWPKARYYDRFISEFEKLESTLYFADGNHEDHHTLPSHKDLCDPWQTGPNVFHVPRGFKHEAFGLNVMFFGGARSVDRAWRQIGISWFPEELPDSAEWDRALAHSDIDIVVAHDVPMTVDFNYPSHGSGPWPMQDTMISEEFRLRLDEIVEANPNLQFWLAGHHHVRKTVVSGGVGYHVLNMEELLGSLVLLDTETMQISDLKMEEKKWQR